MNYLKSSLNDEFTRIFKLCEEVLGSPSSSQNLVVTTLQTLQKFLSWIPLGYIFETSLISSLISKFFPIAAFRTATLDCLTEIAALSGPDIPPAYYHTLKMMLVALISRLVEVIPPSVNLVTAYEEGSDEDCLFITRLALFLSTYLRSHLSSFEVSLEATGRVECEEVVLQAVSYAIRISEVDDDEIFKTCLELWQNFAKDMYTFATTTGASSSGSFGVFSPLSSSSPLMGSPIVSFYERHGILRRLRHVIIDKMARPEEVIIVEDENGDIVRELTKDTEMIAQYKTMREVLVYLTHLNYEDVEAIMLYKLEAQVEGGQFTWNGLNTLCWAVGSISGAMSENDEKKFLVTVIKDLLKLCEEQRGKDNKAVVASNIMYVVGQYPRFLRAHWKFLKTVVNKLFEFMHEYHPGVQDMACDTFLKIAQKCKRKFTTPQTPNIGGVPSPDGTNVLDTQPYLLTLIQTLPRHIADLQSHQVLSFYESMATMLSDKGPSVRLNRDDAMLRLMELCNSSWTQLMGGGEQRVCQLDAVRELSRILKTNAVVCQAAGSGVYLHQLSLIFLDMMNLYRLYSVTIREACVSQGDMAPRLTLFKAMRGVKSEVLELLSAFVTGVSDIEGGGEQVVMQSFMPPVMKEVLEDYRLSPPAARDAKVLSFFASAVAALKHLLKPLIPSILEAIFEPTLSMITTNMLDYPEHRTCFFRFIREANTHCFEGLFVPMHQKLIVDSVIWASKHTERNISEMGLEVLMELLSNLSRSEESTAQAFYQAYLLIIIQDVLGLLTDRLHKSGFKLQAAALRIIFHAVQSGQVRVPLFEGGNNAGESNAIGLRNHVGSLLLSAFPNLTRSQVAAFVMGLFDENMDLAQFKQHMRDFLIQIKVRILFIYKFWVIH